MLQQKSFTKCKVKEVTCSVCGFVCTQYNIGAHVSKRHGLDSVKYKIDHGLMKDPNDMYANCLTCNNKFKKPKPVSTCCSDDCYNELKRVNKIKKSRQTFTDPKYYVECMLCGYRSKNIQRHIKCDHNLSTKEYKKQFGVSSVVCEDSVENFTTFECGDKNPAYRHEGKFSSLSKNFHKYNNLDETEVTEKINAVSKKIGISNKHNGNNSTTISYWLDKGYSQEEAEIMLSERQTTFTLDKCIERHGPIDGLMIWQDRQERWQETLNSKSQDEIDKINAKKSSKINYRSLWSLNLDADGLFYIIRVKDNSYKIGITSRSLEKRYRNTIDKNNIVVCEKVDDINHAFMIEQILKRRHFDKIIKDDYGQFGWTEVINNVTSTELLNEIDCFLRDKTYTLNVFETEVKRNE